MASLAENLIRLQEAKEDIADAIIEMGGTASSTDGLEDMPDAIRTIQANPTLITKSITANGTYDASDDSADGYSEVTVAVPETYVLLFVTTETGVTITVSKGGITLPTQTCEAGEELVFNIPESGTWTVSGSNNVTDTVSISEQGLYYTEIIVAHTYGVIWDKSSSTILTRTDDAASFSDPNPYYAGMSGSPSSPFDNLMPWSGMIKETVDGNVFVKIPKFWYKITNTSSSLSIQISDKAQTGFKVSPAHRAFNTSDTEKDFVYVGRYKCNSSYGSTTGQYPKTSINITQARIGCKAIGNGKSYQTMQMDFATFWTIRMLYLVEFANWNSQDCIGYGCSPSGAIVPTGYTDSMTYHTGTDRSSRTTYGGTQYRWIEGLWDNAVEWCDGIRFDYANVIVYNDPANYSDDSSTGAVIIGSRSTSSGYTGDFFTPSNSDFDWALYPNYTYNGAYYNSYLCDYCSYSEDGVLYVGGGYSKSLSWGLFCLYNVSTSYSQNHTGARLILYT